MISRFAQSCSPNPVGVVVLLTAFFVMTVTCSGCKDETPVDVSPDIVLDTPVDAGGDFAPDIDGDVSPDLPTETEEVPSDVAPDTDQDVQVDREEDIATDIPPEDAQDQGDDVQVDIEEEVVADIPEDVAPDMEEEIVPDIPEDQALDIDVDPQVDTEEEIVSDIPEDVPPDVEDEIIPDIPDESPDLEEEVTSDIPVDVAPDLEEEIVADIPDIPDEGGDAGPLTCTDWDDDGFAVEGGDCGPVDCHDFVSWIFPDAEEVCNGVDDNCDGEVDEGFELDCVPCTPIDQPVCSPGDVRTCGTDRGQCVAGVEVCDATGQWSGDCQGETPPDVEVLDGLDNDCNGTADEDLWNIDPLCPGVGTAWRVGDPTGEPDGLTWETAFPTLEAALAVGTSCDEIWVLSGTRPLLDTVDIEVPVLIYGGFDGDEEERDDRDPTANVTVFDGGGDVHCFAITADTLLDGVTVRNCHSDTAGDEALLGGAIHVSGAELHLVGATFLDNRADTTSTTAKPYGGAVYASNNAVLYIEDSHFEGNFSKWYGGAVAAVNSTVLVRGSQFIANEIRDWTGSLNIFARGGAIFSSGTGSLTVIDSLFEDNYSWMEGGAIFAFQTDLHVLGCTFLGNVSHSSSSGIQVDDATAVIHGSLFEGNGIPLEESGKEGVVDVYGYSNVTVSDCDFVDNDDIALSVYGYEADATLIVADTSFTGNLRSLSSFVATLTLSRSRIESDRSLLHTVDVSYSDATITGCTFLGNAGRAIDFNRGTADIDASVFLSNHGHFYGGAFALDDLAQVDVTNSIFADNYCQNQGSIAFLDNTSTMHMAHVTLVGNSMAQTGGAAIRCVDHSVAEITNAIVWGNWPAAISWDAPVSAVMPTYSVVPYRSGWDNPDLHNLIVDPALVDPAAGDFRLAPWSPAIDGGTAEVAEPPGAPANDLVGRARNLDGDGDDVSAPDPGALEYVYPRPDLPPVALAEEGLLVSANGVPLSWATLDGGMTCDPEDDPLTYTWYGPRGQAEGSSPEVMFPEGTSIVTLVTHDGLLPSNPSTVSVQIVPCQWLTATRSESGALLTWTRPDPAAVFRAPASDPSRFLVVAQAAVSGYEDVPPAELDTALYAVVTDDGTGPCASNVAAVYVGDDPPANGAPIIYSTPSDYGTTASQGSEPATVYEALFGVPYGYQVLAVDPDGDPLAFALLLGPSGTTLHAETGLMLWTPDETGHHEVSLEVTDGRGGVATQSFTLRVDNRPPVADAGRNVTLAEAGAVVTLDGSGSIDPDGDDLSFAWQLISAPADSVAVLSDPAAEQPTITPDLPGRYTISLVVSDSSLDSLPDFVTVSTLDLRPVAVTNYPNVPTQYQSTHGRGDLVQLDGTDSKDHEGRPLSYLWSFTRLPEGSTATLDDPTDPRPTFVADVFGEWDLRLVVKDGYRTSFPAYAFIAARNRDPVAKAGDDRVAAIGDTVSFDCSLSHDPDGEPLICRWYLMPPGGSTAELSGEASESGWYEYFEVSFVPDKEGTYDIQHQVEDPSERTSDDWVVVTVAAGTPNITSLPVLDAQEGVEWVYQATTNATDLGSDPWSLDLSPPGMVVNPTTGRCSWTPGADQVGDHDVVLRVTDESNLYNTQAFTVSVVAAPRPPRIGCPAEMTVVAGSTLARRLEAHDPNAADIGLLTFEKGAFGPEALTIAGDTGLVFWQPTDEDIVDPPVEVEARVVDPSELDDTCTFAVRVIAAADADGDFDGVTPADGDCDDEDPSIHPGARDVAGDGIDQDCADGDALRSVAVEGPAEPIELLVGETTLVPHVIYIDRTDAEVDGIEVLQEVYPDDGGLGLESDLPEMPDVLGSQTRLAGARLTAETPGDYELVTHVTDLDTGQEAEAVTPVRVLAGTTRARLLAPGFSPSAVPVNKAVLVDVAVRIVRDDLQPEFLWLDRTDEAGVVIGTAGWLLDNGEGADIGAGDGVYSGTIEVPATGEGSLWFRAETEVPAGADPVVSEIGELPVTRFPIGAPPSDLDDLVFHPTSGVPLLADQISVVFEPGTTPDTIEAVAENLGGSVTGFLPTLGVYVLSLPPAESGDALVAQLEVIRGLDEVADADASGIVRAQAVTVPDPVQDQVVWSSDIHSDQAWVLGFGGRSTAIAVVDTGIDTRHPELRHNHAAGENVFCTPTWCRGIEDDHAHGTMVTGIIAAESNDDGIAGILPEARVLVVKGLDLNGAGTTENMADAIEAALARGVMLINASFGQFAWEVEDPLLMTRTDERVDAKGALLVAAAGNENTVLRLFPAALPHALAVGGVGLEVNRRWDRSPSYPDSGSNYGNWVDLAAPADSVFTTAPTTSLTGWNANLYCFDYTVSGMPPLLTTLAERREKGCYTTQNGTSLSTPMVVGAGGLLLERFPYMTASEVRLRLEQTAHRLTGPGTFGLGHGLLDVFQVVFNGSFEVAEASDWVLAHVVEAASGAPGTVWVEDPTGYFAAAPLHHPGYHPAWPPPDDHGWNLLRYSGVETPSQDFRHVDQVPGGVRVRHFGPILPADGEFMAMLSTGRGNETMYSIYDPPPGGYHYCDGHYLDILEQRFTLAPGQSAIDLSFQYDLVTEEQVREGDPSGLPSPDYFSVVLQIGDEFVLMAYGHVIQLEWEGRLQDLTGASLTEGYPLRHTGWIPIYETVALDPGETGPVTLRFALADGWDRAFDSVLLVDDVRIE